MGEPEWVAAIRQQDDGRLAELLAKNPGLAEARWEPYSALGYTVSRGNAPAARLVARSIGERIGERIDAPDAVVNGPIRYTALAYAVARGDKEMARVLLEEGAGRDAPYTRDNGRTWLQVKCDDTENQW